MCTRSIFKPALLCCAIFLGACNQPRPVLDARALLRGGDHQRALQRAQEGLKEIPRSLELYKIIIHCHLAGGDPAQGVNAMKQWERLHGRDRDLLRYLSLTMLRWGLIHQDPEVRLAAIQGIRETDAEPLWGDMLQRLSDPHEVVRTWAAVALSGSPAGAEVLQEQLKSDNPTARSVAVTSLGRLAGNRALKAVARAIEDPAKEVRAAAARGLAHIKDQRALPHLRKLMQDPQGTVRAAAIAAVGRLGFPSGAPPLRWLLQDPFPGARLAAATALHALLGKEALPLLRTVAGQDDLPLALQAGMHLAAHGEVQPVLNAVAKSLVDKSWTVRAAGCNSAGSVQDRVALSLLQRALRDSEPRVRLAAARATYHQGNKQAAALAANSLHSLFCQVPTKAGNEDSPLCQQAASLWARAGEPKGLDTLKRLSLQGAAPGIRSTALGLALQLGAGPDHAIQALADPTPAVALKAATWLYAQYRD